MEQGWSGSVLEGTKINGWLEGEGRCVLPNGVIYEGQFKEGNFHGRGKFAAAVRLTISLRNIINTVYGGLWHKRQLHGAKLAWST